MKPTKTMTLTKKVLPIVLILGAALVSYFSLQPAPRCAWCPTYTCYNATACGASCTCMTVAGKVGGQCVSFQAAEELGGVK